MRTTYFTVLLLAALLGCDRGTTPMVGDTGAMLEPSEQAQRAFDAIQDRIGDGCLIDNNCASPLRCLDGACAVPVAMSAERSSDTPRALFYTPTEPTYYLELVITFDEQRRGLMDRPWLEDDWGMLFVYDSERPRSFWMQDTYIPLDMVFVDADLVVVGVVENAVPLDRMSVGVEGNSQWVIELNAGEAAEHGIEGGTRLELLNMPDDLR